MDNSIYTPIQTGLTTVIASYRQGNLQLNQRHQIYLEWTHSVCIYEWLIIIRTKDENSE